MSNAITTVYIYPIVDFMTPTNPQLTSLPLTPHNSLNILSNNIHTTPNNNCHSLLFIYYYYYIIHSKFVMIICLRAHTLRWEFGNKKKCNPLVIISFKHGCIHLNLEMKFFEINFFVLYHLLRLLYIIDSLQSHWANPFTPLTH